MSVIEDDLTRIEEGTIRLQKQWDRFFSGQERKAPFEARQRLDRLVRKYVGVEIRNNVDRFRFQSLTARYNTLGDMWNRRLRAIEEGRPTVSPLLQRARDAAEVESSERRTSRDAVPPAPCQIRLSTLREDDSGVQELYEQFKSARASLGEPAVKLESFQKLIAQHRARLLESKDAVAVDFRISTQDGKVTLKAKPVRTD